ncbi:hypothetical protein QUF74_06815 [Candidatus Halobeggiatoa sp. HSG11]|nr:hypothetical protein [Candidatus Halobeggiatoa sp. HSG11]
MITNNHLNSQSNQSILIQISPEQIINAVKILDQEQQENLIEDLLATISPNYLKSIKEARVDYQQNKIYSHNDVFGNV